MKPLLGPDGLAALERFARPGTLLALDYDGTLAPIVDEPTQAHMREETRTLLAQVTHRFATVVITGRARMDVLRLLVGVQPLEVIGNHGLEAEGTHTARFAARVQGWNARLHAQLRNTAGVRIENKRYSLTIHFRASPDKAAAQADVWRAVAGLDGVRLIGGKDIVNLVPQDAVTKGEALRSAMARHACNRAIFIGDDETDEDVFRLRDPERILAVRVGLQETSAAAYRLRDQSEMDELLARLLAGSRLRQSPVQG